MALKGEKLKSIPKQSDQNDNEIRLPSDREVALRAKYEQKQHDLTEFKMRVHKAEEQHKWLDREAHRLRIEMSEYKQFILKKKNLRETQMMTLSDYHKEEIQNINQCKDDMTEKYLQRKKELQMQLIEKSKLLRNAQRELDDMEGYRIIREQQSDEIKLLEHEVKQMRAEQVHEIDRFKSDFRKEVEQNQIFQEIQLAEFEEQAKLEVEKYLYERTINIQNENTELKKKLQRILKRQEELNKLRNKLEEEQLHLIVQLKLTTDLKKIRLDKTSGNLPKKFLRYH